MMLCVPFPFHQNIMNKVKEVTKPILAIFCRITSFYRQIWRPD